MPIERVVVDASPLIILFKSQLEQLLPKLFNKIIVPDAVWKEVTADYKRDIAARTLPTASWATRLDLPKISPDITTWGLGAGESEVLSYALNHNQYRAIVDDKAARRCAKILGIRTLGTGGLLVLAKRRGIIPSVLPALIALEDAGLWLSPNVIKLLKQQAGEDI